MDAQFDVATGRDVGFAVATGLGVGVGDGFSAAVGVGVGEGDERWVTCGLGFVVWWTGSVGPNGPEDLLDVGVGLAEDAAAALFVADVFDEVSAPAMATPAIAIAATDRTVSATPRCPARAMRLRRLRGCFFPGRRVCFSRAGAAPRAGLPPPPGGRPPLATSEG